MAPPFGASPSATPAYMMQGVSTPAILQGSPPWPMQTPEVSPVLWERAPSSATNKDGIAGGLSKEILRKLCEPFFEQMLDTLCMVLQNPAAMEMMVEQEAFGCLNQKLGSQTDQGSDDQNGDAGDLGAFSSVMNEPQSTYMAFPSTMQNFDFIPAAKSDSAKRAGGKGELEQVHEQDKQATIMVCRHWKSKGWCRLGDGCKFSHPEHKCGVGAGNAKSSGGGSAPAADQSSDDDGATGDAKKSGRKRRSKAKGPKAAAPPGGQSGEVHTLSIAATLLA